MAWRNREAILHQSNYAGAGRIESEQDGWLALRLHATRHRLDRDALRFARQVHQGLPTHPPRGPKTLVLFAHYDPHGVVDPYVVHYLEELSRLDTTIIFVSGSPELTSESVEPLRSLCAGIYTRRTLSLDFGSWHLAWSILRLNGWSLDQFDRLILANDSVYGPLFPLEEMFESFEGADMYGSIESQEVKPHLQSFFLAFDLNSRTRPFLNDFWDGFRYVVDKHALIRKYEFGLTAMARKAGLRIKPYVSVGAITEAYALSQGHQWSESFDGPPINNTLYFYDGLIEHLRFPFMKAVLPRTKSPHHDSLEHLGDFIGRKTTYPYALIQANVNRLSCNATVSTKSPTTAPPTTWTQAPAGLRFAP
jgi:lipopolysaccharide biosynthesis protein